MEWLKRYGFRKPKGTIIWEKPLTKEEEFGDGKNGTRILRIEQIITDSYLLFLLKAIDAFDYGLEKCDWMMTC